LFDYPEGEMASVTANSPADIFSESHRIFQEVTKETFMTLDDEWITRLEWRTEHKGDYYDPE
jgi:hypothetical protein